MRRAILMLILLILLFVSANVVFAVGKITVDPNASANKASDELEQKTDIRLVKKVTYEARRKMVSVILAELSEQAGVTFKAGYNNKDWQVRDRRMNIFAKDTPLFELMNSIARVMKFKWSKSDDTAPAYRLFMDRKTLLDAENKRLREEKSRVALHAERCRKMLVSYENAKNLSAEELARLKEESPYFYLMVKSGAASQWSAFFKESSVAREALISGDQLCINAGTLSPAAQQALVNAINGCYKVIYGRSFNNVLSDDVLADMGRITFRMNHYGDPVKARKPSRTLSLMSTQFDGEFQERGLFSIDDPDSSESKELGKILIQRQELENNSEELRKQIDISPIKEEDFAEPVVKHQDDPFLEKKITLEAEQENIARHKNPQLDSVLASLSKSSGFAVVSDSFNELYMPPKLEDKETGIKDILDKIAYDFDCNWDKHSSVIEFQDREWFKKRALQIPEEWLERWRSTMRKTGTLDLVELGQIAMLSPEQIQMNVACDEMLKDAANTVVWASLPDLLRFIVSLNANQRTILVSESGLDLAVVTPDQRKLADQFLNKNNPRFIQNPDARIIIKLLKKQVDRHFGYFVEATTSDDIDSFAFVFSSPVYKSPEQLRQEELKQPPVIKIGKRVTE